jgi:hypothetical protein
MMFLMSWWGVFWVQGSGMGRGGDGFLLWSKGCEEPHAAFEEGEDKTVFERIRDEEEMMGDGFEMQSRDGGAYLGTAVR